MDLVFSFWDTINSPTFTPLSDRDLSNNFVCAFEHPSLAPPRSPPVTSGLRFWQLTLLPIPRVHSDHQASPPYGPHLCIASNSPRFSAPTCASQFRDGELCSLPPYDPPRLLWTSVHWLTN